MGVAAVGASRARRRSRSTRGLGPGAIAAGSGAGAGAGAWDWQATRSAEASSRQERVVIVMGGTLAKRQKEGTRPRTGARGRAGEEDYGVGLPWPSLKPDHGSASQGRSSR